MTDSSEAIDGLCDPMFLTNRPLTREDLKRMYEPGRAIQVQRIDRIEPLGAPLVHADPRHPLHHLWVDAEDRMEAELHHDSTNPDHTRNRLMASYVMHEPEPKRSLFDSILGGLI